MYDIKELQRVLYRNTHCNDNADKLMPDYTVTESRFKKHAKKLACFFD